MAYKLSEMMDNLYADAAARRLQPIPRCGTLTHDNHDTALLRHPQALNWSGEVTWTPGGTAIIRGEKGDSTYSGLKDQK